jgi:hypothetical protein
MARCTDCDAAGGYERHPLGVLAQGGIRDKDDDHAETEADGCGNSERIAKLARQ